MLLKGENSEVEDGQENLKEDSIVMDIIKRGMKKEINKVLTKEEM
jgi:hypothetical protein